MSEKLIVEFLPDTGTLPVAVVLSWNGGDNPASAALTIAAFYTNLPTNLKTRYMDARELASRFILWRSELSGCSASSPHIDACLSEHDPTCSYQLARIRRSGDSLHVEVTADEYTTESELQDAAAALRAARLPFEFLRSGQRSFAGKV